jgi:hypothetical protein
MDLFMATEVKEAWFNIYEGHRFYDSAEAADRADRADAHGNPSFFYGNRLGGKAHRITWEE